MAQAAQGGAQPWSGGEAGGEGGETGGGEGGIGEVQGEEGTAVVLSLCPPEGAPGSGQGTDAGEIAPGPALLAADSMQELCLAAFWATELQGWTAHGGRSGSGNSCSDSVFFNKAAQACRAHIRGLAQQLEGVLLPHWRAAGWLAPYD